MSYFVFCNVSFSGFIRWVEEERANFLLSLTRIVIMWFSVRRGFLYLLVLRICCGISSPEPSL